MDDGIFAIFGLFILITFILPWWQQFRIGKLREEMDELQARITKLTSQLLVAGVVKKDVLDIDLSEEAEPEKVSLEIKENISLAEQVRKDAEKATKKTAALQKDKAKEDQKTSKIEKSEPTKQLKAKTQKQHKEYNLAAKLPVWIGSISLIFGAFFLIKYSIEQGLLGPAMRVTLGGVFGVGLLFLGQYLAKRDDLANALRMAQGVVGAGVVTLYFVFYAATNMYDFISHLAGFAGMVAVTATAMWMSMRHGRAIAAFGIIGGILTPALMSSGSGNTLMLFAYLFVLTSGMFWVFARQKWWGLAAFTIIGAYAWVMFWFGGAFDAAEAFILMFFTLGLSIVVLISTAMSQLRAVFAGKELREEDRKLTRTQHSLNVTALAAAVVTVYAIGANVTLSFFDWAILALPTLALYVMSYIQPNIYQKALMAKMVTSILLFGGWSEQVTMSETAIVIAGFVAIYGLVPYLLIRRAVSPLFNTLLQVLALYGVYIVTYLVNKDLMDDMGWGAIALGMAAAFLSQVKYVKHAVMWQASDAEEVKNGLLARYALAVTGFISTAMVIILPSDYYALAFAGQIAATAYMFDRYQIAALKKMIMWLFVLFVLFNAKIFALITGNLFATLTMGWLPEHTVRDLTVALPSLTLGLSFGLMIIGYYYLDKACAKVKLEAKNLMRFMRYAIGFVGIAAFYLSMRQILGVSLYEEAGFADRAFITTGFATLGYILAYTKLGQIFPALHQPGRKLLHLAVARFVYFDLLFQNPYWVSDQWVGDMVLFNHVTWVYGGASLFIGWGFWRGYIDKLSPAMQRFYKVALLAAVFAFVTLSVRQVFHGGFLTSGGREVAELYAYSAVWLLTGLGLLALGIRGDNHAARMASVGFIGVTVCKVFFIDASVLDGVWRIASFMGLGICLIGLSHFYSKYVFIKRDAEEEPGK